MSEFVRLTLVRYPPRDLGERRGRRGVRIPGRRAAAALFAVAWLPAGFNVASAVAGDVRTPADSEAWMHLAALAAGGVPLVLACALLWRKGLVVAACAALAILAPATVAGTVAVEGFGPVAAATVGAAASLPAWLLYTGRRAWWGPGA